MKQLRTNIYSLAFGGDGVGKVDGKVCFVRDTLPGEDVLFKVVKETSSYIKGEVVEILDPSPDRVAPECRYYGRCGGCQLQHISYEKELFYKKEQAVQLIRRIAGLKNFDCGDILASRDCYHYRTNVTLNRNPGGRFGYYARDGRTIMEIDECSVAEDALNREFADLAAGPRQDRITLKADHKGQVWVEGRPGERFFVDRYRDTDIFLSPRAFSQCNRYISEKISQTLEEWNGAVDKDTALFDIYCGVGFFSFLWHGDFGIKVGIDSEKLSIDCAKTTVKTSGSRAMKFYKGEAEKEFLSVFARNRKKRNILLLDPPRKGTSKKFLDELKNTAGIERIYYISCDPARMARDIKIITDRSNWCLDRVALFDMFPRTRHIEALIEFKSE